MTGVKYNGKGDITNYDYIGVMPIITLVIIALVVATMAGAFAYKGLYESKTLALCNHTTQEELK